MVRRQKTSTAAASPTDDAPGNAAAQSGDYEERPNPSTVAGDAEEANAPDNQV